MNNSFNILKVNGSTYVHMIIIEMVCKLMNLYMVWNNFFMYYITRLMHISCLRNLKKVMLIIVCISKEFNETLL